MAYNAKAAIVQGILVRKGFDLGNTGPQRNGVDGDPGNRTWDALVDYLSSNSENPASLSSGTPLIDPGRFARWAPSALPGAYEALEAAAQANGFKGLVLAHWLGQMYVESKGFSTLVENLNYSVEGLKKTFGRHRITEADCLRYGRTSTRPADQKAIANLVYGGAWGKKNLGNTEPNDGWDFRGSGFKQRTGRYNMSQSKYTAEELRTDVNKAALDAADFFVWKGCHIPAMTDDVTAVTELVNGGHNGLDDRKVRTKEAKGVING